MLLSRFGFSLLIPNPFTNSSRSPQSHLTMDLPLMASLIVLMLFTALGKAVPTFPVLGGPTESSIHGSNSHRSYARNGWGPPPYYVDPNYLTPYVLR